MSVELVGIAFDHGAGSPQTRALHIRHDGATAVQADVGAYALVPTKGQQLTIEVTLRFPNLGSDTLAAGEVITVRANRISTSASVLGNVRERDVTVPVANRQAAFVFELAAPKLHTEGVGKYTVAWEWQFRLTPTSPWVTFHTSTSTIYITLDVPAAPWTQATDNLSRRRWPWVRLLNLACVWADGVRVTSTKPAAVKLIAKRIEKSLYALGESGKLIYKTGDARYCVGGSSATLKITTFLEDIEGPGENLKVFCTECAAVVATAVNCLGGDLSLLRLDRPAGKPIHLNSYILIGKTNANEGSFNFHDVAVRTSGTSTQVFDATLKPDWDVNVSNTIHNYKLAQGKTLGKTEVKPKGTAYLQRLLEADVAGQWTDLMLCKVPVPCLDYCDGPPPPDPCADQQFRTVRSEIAQAVPLEPIPFLEPPNIVAPSIDGFRVVGRVDNPARFAALAPLISKSAEFLYVAASGGRRGNGGRSRPKTDSRQFTIAVAWSPTPAEAWDAMAWLMVRTPAHLSAFPPKNKDKTGDFARGSTREGAAYMVRGNVLVHVARVGAAQAPTEMIARRVDQAILQRWSSPAHEPPPGAPPSSSDAGRKVRQTLPSRSD